MRGARGLVRPGRGRSRRALAILAAALALLATAATAAGAVAPPPGLSGNAADLIEAGTGQSLYGLDADGTHAIASTTKLMTALLTLEHVRDLSTMFTQNDYYPSSVDSQIGLVPGERMSVHDLLLALLLPSADDAAEDLAYNVGRGSTGYFVGMMNVRARELGLRHTHYATPSGLDTPGNYSSASDLVALARYLLAHQPFFARAVALPAATLYTGSSTRHVVNRNDLVARYRWIHGVKTGHTLDAGYVLVGAARRRGMTLISAVLGTPSEHARDADTLSLLNWGYANFHLVAPLRRGEVLARLPVKGQPRIHAPVLAAGGWQGVAALSARVRVVLHLPRRLIGPLRRGTRVGTAVVLEGTRPMATVALLLGQRLRAAPAPGSAAGGIIRTVTLVFVLAALGAAALLALTRRERGREGASAPPEPAA